jgi:hypothetical protein
MKNLGYTDSADSADMSLSVEEFEDNFNSQINHA